MAGVVTIALEWTRSVWPSGSALATALVPIVVPPPGRLSMRKVWPSWADTCSNTVRGTMSVALPGAYGTITRTGLVGQVSAPARTLMVSTGNAHRATISRPSFFICPLRPWLSASSVIRPAHQRTTQRAALLETEELALMVAAETRVEPVVAETALERPSAFGGAAAPARCRRVHGCRASRQRAQRQRQPVRRRRLHVA